MNDRLPYRWLHDLSAYAAALDLKCDIFNRNAPKVIALSLKRSVEHSRRHKGMPLQSAMGVLTLYMNRAGDNLPPDQHKVLEQTKDELRSLFCKVE